jgi:hypothetical protein
VQLDEVVKEKEQLEAEKEMEKEKEKIEGTEGGHHGKTESKIEMVVKNEDKKEQ